MMKIAVVDFTGITKLPRMDRLEGCGASDRAILELVRTLPGMGHEVHFFCATSARGKFDGATWHNIVEDDFDCDVLIMQRVMVYREKFRYKKMIMWLHDDLDAPVNKNLNEISHIPDAFIVLSTYHKEKLLSLNVPEEKINIIPEGVSAQRWRNPPKNDHACVYASAPFKGLPLLMKLWPRIKERVSDATLHVCSGMMLYKAGEKDVFFQPLYDAMEKDDSITNHGVLSNERVLDVMSQCAIMVYPNFFKETFCAAAMESISQDTPVITSALGALPETVGNCGVCVGGDPKSQAYQDAFVDEVCKTLLIPARLELMRINCNWRLIMTWHDVIEKIDELARRMVF
jgi:glycosyltransferase involved in cell wall biosynthesis